MFAVSSGSIYTGCKSAVVMLILIIGIGITLRADADLFVGLDPEIEELLRASSESFSTEEAVEFAERAYYLADSLGLVKEKGFGALRSGEAWIARGDYLQAVNRLTTARDYFQELDLQDPKFRVIIYLGETYRAAEDFEEALVFLKKAEVYYKDTGNASYLARVYNRLAATRFELFYRALEHNVFLTRLQTTGEDPFEIMDEYLVLTEHYGHLLNYLEKSDSLAILENKEQIIASNMILSAALQSRLNKNDQALTVIDEALEYIEGRDLFWQKQLALINKARIVGHGGLEDYAQAIELAQQALDKAEEAQVNIYIFMAAEILRSNYLQTGNIPEAYEMLKNMWDAYKASETENMKLTMMAMEYDHAIQQREVHIQNQNRQLWTVIISGTILICLIAVFLITLFRKNRLISDTNKKLSKSELKYRMLSENSTDVIWTMDMDMNTNYCSPSIQNFLGYSAEEYIKSPAKDLTTSEFYSRLKQYHRRELELEERPDTDPNRTLLIEGEFIAKDGTIKHAEIHMRYLRDEDNRAIGIIGVTRDITARKKAEQKIHRSEAQKTAILESMNDHVLVVNSDGMLTDFFLPEDNHLDIDTKTQAGKRFEDLPLPADVSEQIQKKLENCLNDNKPKQHTFHLELASGTTWFDLRISPIKDAKGKVEGATCVVRNITRQKKASFAAAEYAEFLDIILDHMPDYLFVKDQDFNLIRANKKFLGLISDSGKSLLGKKTYGIFDPETRKLFEEEDKKTMVEGYREKEIEVELAGGNKTTVIIKKIKFENSKGEPFILGLVSDITDRKRAEKEVEKHQRSLELLIGMARKFINIPTDKVLDSVKTALKTITTYIQADYGGIFLKGHPSGKWRLYLSEHSFNDQIDEPHLQPDDLELLLAKFSKSRKPLVFSYKMDSEGNDLESIMKREKLRSLVTIPLIDGSHVKGLIKFVSFGGSMEMDEKTLGVLEVFAELIINVESRANSYKKLERATTEAKKANRAKSDFLANMSHEIRTPMNAIIGFSELLQSTGLEGSQLKYLNIIHRSGHNLLGIINDILDLSKIEAGKLKLNFVWTHLPRLVIQTIDLVRYSAWQKNLKIILDIDPNMPEQVYFDPLRLRQILSNLLNNAVKFTDSGFVELKIAALPLESGRWNFRFSIRDTGIGIKREHHDKLFEAFEQVDTSYTRRFGGTGLGLKISNQLVRQMGGEIKLESDAGMGAHFFFDLSFKAQPLEVNKDIDLLKEKKCLIIEPCDKSRELMSRLISNFGGIPEKAADQNELEGNLNSHSFDVIICERELPGTTGFELFSLINHFRNERNIDLPFVLTSSTLDEIELENQCNAKGIKFRIQKPIHKYNLLSCLKQVVEEKSLKAAKNVNKGNSSTNELVLVADNLTILIAEDNEFNMILIKKVLEKEFPGAKILEALDGKQAVKVWKKHHPGIVLMDVQMPEMDGNKATRKIRTFESKNNLERSLIIGLSAAALAEDQKKGMKSGMNAFLTKPLEVAALKKIIYNYFGAYMS